MAAGGKSRIRLASLRRGLGSGISVWAILLTTGAVFALSILISPLAMEEIERLIGVDWPVLSSVGETYGAVSALISGLALIGVTTSLAYQARDSRVNRIQSFRQMHNDLLGWALQDDRLMECWGNPSKRDGDRNRKNTYINMIISFWESNYSMGYGSLEAIRGAVANDFFTSQIARDFWAENREMRLSYAKSEGRKIYELRRMIDEEYMKSSAPPVVNVQGASVSGPGYSPRPPREPGLKKGGLAVIAGVAAVAVGGVIIHRIGRR